jgi:hypothetical protein
MNSILWRAGAVCVPFCVATTAQAATGVFQGRWEGEVLVPGVPLALIVDLTRVGVSKWTGSAIMPGLGIKGAPLSDISVNDSDVTATLSGALRTGGATPPQIKVRLTAAGELKGDFEQGGNSAPLRLRRTGDPQVEPVPKSTVVSDGLEGTWSGRLELDGYPREVTLTLSNHPKSVATAELVIVGKRTNRVPVDLVAQDAQFLKIESDEAGIMFEGRWSAQAGEIQGSIQMGSLEVPLVLRHPAPANGGRS